MRSEAGHSKSRGLTSSHAPANKSIANASAEESIKQLIICRTMMDRLNMQ